MVSTTRKAYFCRVRRKPYICSLVPALLVVVVVLQVLTPEVTEGFSTQSSYPLWRHTNPISDTRDYSPLIQLGSNNRQNNVIKYPRKSRPFSSKFFVASTTGPSLNSGNEKNALSRSSSSSRSSNQEEVPWECVLDPTCSDHCLDFIDHHHDGNSNHMIEFGTWAKKREEDEDRVTLIDKVSMATMSSAAIAAFSVLLFWSGPGSWRYFLAGGLCAAASHAIATPIDVVKTRKQVDRELQKLGFVQATQKIVKDDGIGALLVGLGPTIWGYLLEGAMKFGVYEVLKPVTLKLLSSLADATSLAFLRSQIIAFIACGCVAGIAASFVLCPMEALRIRLVSEPDLLAPKGWIQGGCRMIKREGVLSLWKGIAPQIYKQVPYTVTKNVSFDYFTKFAYWIAIAYGFSINHATKFTIPFLSAILASALSCVSSQPGDMLLSLVSARRGEFRSTHDIARDILRSEQGIRGFFVGLNERLYHVGITVTLQLVLYDVLKRLCGGIATGSVGH